jgi:hypothetical protein
MEPTATYINQVARHTLIYLTCIRDDLYSLDDIAAASEREDGSLSPATLQAAHLLGGLDWDILQELADQHHEPSAYWDKAKDIAPYFPYRTDALLHAAPTAPRRRVWSARFFRHWHQVVREIARLEGEGYTLPHYTLNDIATEVMVG